MIKRLTGVHRGQRFRFLIGVSMLLGALATTAVPLTAAENWFEQGLADLKQGRYQAAADKFTLAIEAVPEDYEALNNRGFARIYIGDYAGAIADCSRSIAIHPGSAKAYNNRGFARLFTGEFEAAVQDFNQALAINPRYVDAYSNRCLAWTRQGDYDQAVADCTEALHLNPRSAKALYNRGYARDRQGNPGGALRDYIQALKVNPAYIEVFNNMAWIMATSPDERLRDGRRAVAYAEKAVGNTTDLNFLDTLAAAYAEAGRFDEAVAIENRIISLLASARRKDAIARHVQRMSLYEEGRPYREPIDIQPVSAVTDLEGELATLDKLVFAPEVSTVAYEPAEAARNLTADTAVLAQTSGEENLSPPEPEASLTAPEAYSQSIETAPGVPVEINLSAEAEGIPLTFEIETVPYQGTLQGTLPDLLYTPRPGFEGVDRFTFRARNAAGLSNLATVTITVSEPAPAAETAAPEAAPAEPEAPEAAVPAEDASEGGEPEPAAPPAPEAAAPAEPVTTEKLTEPPQTATPEEGAREPEAPSADAELSETPVGPEAAPAAPAESAGAEAPAVEPEPGGELAFDGTYTIQVYSVKEAAAAAKIVANLAGEGYAAFSLAVEVPEKGLWHRVFINGYPSMAAARKGLEELDPERFQGAFIRRMPSGVNLPAAARAPQPAVPAEAPTIEPAQPVLAPAPDPETPAEAPAPEPEAPAAEPAGEPASEDAADRQAIPVAGETYPYAYQIKSYQQREEAFQLAMELTSQGHTAFLGRGTMGSTGVWYRVYIGCYQTPEAAEKSRAEIARAGFPEAFLTPVTYTIEVQPDESDPAGETLENRLIASGFLPYRLPAANPAGPPRILVGGFRQSEDAQQVLAALEQYGFRGQIQPR